MIISSSAYKFGEPVHPAVVWLMLHGKHGKGHGCTLRQNPASRQALDRLYVCQKQEAGSCTLCVRPLHSACALWHQKRCPKRLHHHYLTRALPRALRTSSQVRPYLDQLSKELRALLSTG